MLSQRRQNNADIAQEVECVLGKDEVTGSNPVISSNTKTALPSHFSGFGCGFVFALLVLKRGFWGKLQKI